MDLRRIWWNAIDAGLVVQEYPPLEVPFTCTLASGRTIELPVGTVLRVGVRRKRERADGTERGALDAAEHYLETGCGQEIPLARWTRQVAGTPYRLEFNEVRQIRPQSGPGQVASACGFACQPEAASHPLSLLRRPVLFHWDLPHRGWYGFANGSVIEPAGHFLLVPAPPGATSESTLSLPHIPQRMTPDVYRDMVAAHREQQSDFITFYNHLRAGGSQDHLHFQMLARVDAFAIEELTAPGKAGGVAPIREFPAAGLVVPLRQSEELIPRIVRLHATNTPFNLVMIGEQVYLFARPATAGFDNGLKARLACLELAGRFILNDHERYLHADADQVAATLRAETRVLPDSETFSNAPD